MLHIIVLESGCCSGEPRRLTPWGPLREKRDVVSEAESGTALEGAKKDREGGKGYCAKETALAKHIIALARQKDKEDEDRVRESGQKAEVTWSFAT